MENPTINIYFLMTCVIVTPQMSNINLKRRMSLLDVKLQMILHTKRPNLTLSSNNDVCRLRMIFDISGVTMTHITRK